MEAPKGRNVYFNPGKPELIFALASLLLEATKNRENLYFYPVNFQHLLDYPPTLSSYVLDLCGEAKDMARFLEKHGHKIRLWLIPEKDSASLQLITTRQAKSYHVVVYPEASCLKKMGELEYFMMTEWLYGADQMAELNRQHKLSSGNSTINYYLKAFRVAQALDQDSNNQKTDLFFREAAKDIALEPKSRQIRELSDRYDNLESNTRKGISSFTTHSPFSNCRVAVNKKIGYADLGKISTLIDLKAIISAGKQRFDILIIYCNYQDQPETGIYFRDPEDRNSWQLDSPIRQVSKRKAEELVLKELKKLKI